MASIMSALQKRQATFNGDGTIDDGDDWYYSDRAEIAKYVIVGVILLILILWLALGAWHANRRVRNGQQPLFYHRWLVSSRYRYPAYGGGYYYSSEPPAYQMQTWTYGPPPPQGFAHGPPPQYQPPSQPPPGASKINPDQTIGVTEVSRENGESGSNSTPNLQQPAPTQAASPTRR